MNIPEVTMPPAYFSILMHYYVSPEPYRKGEPEAPVTDEAIKWFLREGLLCEREPGDTEYGGKYRTTERGAFYVIAALSTPLPEQVWVIPSRSDRTGTDAQ